MCFSILNANAQLGFCGGNSGDPIFTENFGTAPSTTTQHIPLTAPGITNFIFLEDLKLQRSVGNYLLLKSDCNPSEPNKGGSIGDRRDFIITKVTFLCLVIIRIAL